VETTPTPVPVAKVERRSMNPARAIRSSTAPVAEALMPVISANLPAAGRCLATLASRTGCAVLPAVSVA
jgi:hypothetical protein